MVHMTYEHFFFKRGETFFHLDYHIHITNALAYINGTNAIFIDPML